MDPFFEAHGAFLEKERAESGRTVQCATILLATRQCPWRCLMCDLWQNMSRRTPPIGAVPKQIRLALAHLGAKPEQIKLYNRGSFFDAAAVPTADYPDIVRAVSAAKNVVVESHPRLVGEKALRLRGLLDGSMEVAMGLETIHPEILPRLNKRSDLRHFSRAAEFLRANGMAARAFILVKPPFMHEAEAVEWAVKSASFAFACGAAVASLIPTRATNREMKQLMAAGQFTPPRLATLEQALEQSLNLRAGRVFADLWDLAAFSRCGACFEKRRARLHRMNLSQTLAAPVHCEVCAEP